MSSSRSSFLRWLEHTDPETFPVGTEADEELVATLDSLDLILVSAVEEAEQLKMSELTGPDLEAHLRALWSHTYARFAAKEVAWLEQIFVTRGKGGRQYVYTDRERRTRVYRLGFPPRQSTRFVTLADRIEEHVRASSPYRYWTSAERLTFIEGLGQILSADPIFRIRDARSPRGQPVTPWSRVLHWWLRAPGAIPPAANHVRYWLDVVTSDIEFRLGTAVSATISAVWSRVAGDELVVPTLDQWRAQTGLPWAAFWIREMVAWGTMEPVVAFLIGANRSTTREEAEQYPERYYVWHDDHYEDEGPDDALHPSRIFTWSQETFGTALSLRNGDPENLSAILLRDFQKASSQSFPVLPCELDDQIIWMDAAGYGLARTEKPKHWSDRFARRHNFVLNVREHSIVCRPV